MRTIELFAGGGGMALGLEQAGLDTVALVEKDKQACCTLRLNRPNWNVIEQDITKVSFGSGEAELITGGFPCQPFSYAGKKLGFSDTRGTLFHDFARIIKEVQPRAFIAENVRGLLTHDSGNTLATIVNTLSLLGYVVRYKLLNAADYGVAQRRERLIIVGTAVDFVWPPTQERITVRQALADVPASEGASYSARDEAIFKLVPAGGNWRDLPRDILSGYAPYLLGKYGGGSTQTAKRLDWNSQSPTLLTTPHQKTTARCHPSETRPLTVREYARLQGFPDSWQFTGSISAKYRQIGNAVPVSLAKALAEALCYQM